MTYNEHQDHSPPPPPSLEKGFDSKVAVLGYLCLCLTALFFSYLLVGDLQTYILLTREDGLVENLTAVAFFLAGLLLFAMALAERSGFQRGIYMLGGLVMTFACGEEISWGQRIFGFATPDFLMDVNNQGEFNVHNINRAIYWVRLRQNVPLLLCMVTVTAFLCRQDRFFGIPLPSVPLVLGFLVSLSHRRLDILAFVFTFFAICALLSKQGRLFMVIVATAVLVLAVAYVERVVSSPHYRFGEVPEYLLGIICLFYSLELLLAQGRLSAISWAPFTGRKLPDGWAFWLMVSSLLIAGSIGLMLFGYNADRLRTAEAFRLIRSAEPVIRSDFDIWLMRNQLIYVKDPCDLADTEPRFFLHIVPADANDLPLVRKPHGFDNLDFAFGNYDSGMFFGGKCLAVKPLPDYEIATIRTGQFVRKKEKGKTEEIWMETFTLNE